MFDGENLAAAGVNTPMASRVLLAWTEKVIVRTLSITDVGKASSDRQFAMVQLAMENLRDCGQIKTYEVRIKQDSVDSPRILVVGWSQMLEFASQTFSVLLSDLTRENVVVSDVMES